MINFEYVNLDKDIFVGTNEVIFDVIKGTRVYNIRLFTNTEDDKIYCTVSENNLPIFVTTLFYGIKVLNIFVPLNLVYEETGIGETSVNKETLFNEVLLYTGFEL